MQKDSGIKIREYLLFFTSTTKFFFLQIFVFDSFFFIPSQKVYFLVKDMYLTTQKYDDSIFKNNFSQELLVELYSYFFIIFHFGLI